MTRREFVSRFVLMEIADDYENLEHICSVVAEDSSQCGLTIAVPEIIRGLVDLIEGGLAKAYRLSTRLAQEIQGVPRNDEFGDYYTHFWATPRGRQLVVSERDWWPFDDLGVLRTDWSPPDGSTEET